MNEYERANKNHVLKRQKKRRKGNLRTSFNILKNTVLEIVNRVFPYVKGVYSVISVISTLTIFSALIIFIIGRTELGNLCDDDLTMQRIKEQLPDGLQISDIYMEDIHGLGNDTMVVLAVNDDGGKNANQFLIFDKVDNDILNQFNNLLGYGSNYKLSYLFSLESIYDEHVKGYSLEILDTVDLTGDLSKEIVVQFMSYPAGNGAYYEIGIFSYSYEKHTYYLLGTYPKALLYETNEIISTVFHDNDGSENNFYNKEEIFNLEYGSKYNNDFFMETTFDGVVLVRTEQIWGDESNVDPHRFTISLFEPIYDSERDELKWRVLFSRETEEYIDYCTKEYVQEFLKKKNSIYGYQLRE